MLTSVIASFRYPGEVIITDIPAGTPSDGSNTPAGDDDDECGGGADNENPWRSRSKRVTGGVDASRGREPLRRARAHASLSPGVVDS